MLSKTTPPAEPGRGGASPAKSSLSARAGGLLVILFLAAICVIPYHRAYQHRSDPLGEDEIYWIGQAYYYHLAVEKQDWSNPDWQLLPARENPVLGKFVIGAGLQLAGLSVTNADWLGVFYIIAKDRPNAWGNGRDYTDREAVLARMSPAVREQALKEGRFDCPIQFVTTARVIMMLFGMISVLAVYQLAAFYTIRPAALLAALLFALHPAVAEACTEVNVDILAVMFSLIAVIHYVLIGRVAWWHWRWPGLGRAFLFVVGGLALAFAVGSKMNAAVAGILGAVLCLVWLASYLAWGSTEAWESFKTVLALLLLALLVFVTTNPVDYPDPVKGVWNTYADQQRSLAVQKTIPAVHRPLQTAGERIRALARMTALQPALFALVVLAFFWDLIKGLGRGKPLPVVALWWLIAVAAVGLWLPFARPRYALPVIVPSVILVAIAAGRVLEVFRPRSS